MGWNAVPKMFRQPHSKSHIFVPETSPVAPFLPSPPPSPCLSAARLQEPIVQSAKAVHPKPPMKILDHPPCSHHRAWQPEMPLVSAPLPQFISQRSRVESRNRDCRIMAKRYESWSCNQQPLQWTFPSSESPASYPQLRASSRSRLVKSSLYAQITWYCIPSATPLRRRFPRISWYMLSFQPGRWFYMYI